MIPVTTPPLAALAATRATRGGRKRPRNAQAVDRVKLSWPGRVWEPGSRPLPGAARIETREVRGDSPETGARLVLGDALDTARALEREGLGGCVALVYVDPPFGSQASYVHEARLDGPADGRVVRAQAYDDRWGVSLSPYLDMLAVRLEALTRLLSPAGTIWVHVDYRASPFVRILLDEILGRDAFVNEIVWRRAPNLGRQATSHQFGRTLDTLVVYGGSEAKLAPPTRLEPIEPSAIRHDDEGRPFTSAPRGDYTDASIARLEKEGRVHRTASGKVYVKYFLVKSPDGTWCRERRVDALWTDVPPLRHAASTERTGFPTQKPRALLDRILACATVRGDLVVDAFAGSGTTGESAHALGRRFVLGDASPLSVATARARLMRAGVPLVVQSCGDVREPAGPEPRVLVRRGRDGIRLVLEEPREPLAWAIDPRFDPSRPFRVAWHSERAPGSRTRPACREATVPKPTGPMRPIGVRVWYDDGTVGTTVLGRS
jgi:DNA modification methylase